METPEKLIDRVVSADLAPFLRSIGYKKSGRTFRAKADPFVRVINVQASQWNRGTEARFTVNLGIYSQVIEESFRPSSNLVEPKEYHCVLRKRIGELMPGNQDTWWNSEPLEKFESLAPSLRHAVEAYAMPWFERINSFETLRIELEGQATLELACVLLLLGKRSEAQLCIKQFMQDIPGTAEFARSWATRNGLDV